MAGGLLPQPKQLIQDNAWNPGIAYQVYTYAAGTLTPKATYQDDALTIANTNPVLANARGEVVMCGAGPYRLILKDSLGNLIWDRDNVEAPQSAVATQVGVLATSFADAAGGGLVGFSHSNTYAAGSVGAKLKRLVFVTDAPFNADPTGATDAYAAIQAATNFVGTTGGRVVLPQGSYKLSQPVVNSSFNFVTWEGAGRNATRVFGSAGTVASLFKIGGTATGVFRCGVAHMSLDTAQCGVDINCGATNTDLDDLYINCSVFGVKNMGDYTVSPVRANQGTRLNRLEITGYSNSGVYNYCAAELYWDQIVCQGGALTVGINLDSASNAIYGGRANLLTNNHGLLIQDTTGISPNPTGVITRPSQMWLHDVLGDTGKSSGIFVSSGFQIALKDCWGGGSQTGFGIALGASATEITLDNCRALGNSQHGLQIASGASHVKVIGGHYYGNGYATTNTYDGINVSAGATNFNIIGAHCYNDIGMGLGNTQRYGVRIESGAGDNFQVIGCNNPNNLSGGISNLATGAAVQIFGNLPIEDNSRLAFGGSAIKSVYTGSATFDTPSLGTTQSAVTSVTVTGAQVGDCVTGISLSSIASAGWILSGSVTGANTVAVTIYNATGSTVDLASGTLRVIVTRM